MGPVWSPTSLESTRECRSQIGGAKTDNENQFRAGRIGMNVSYFLWLKVGGEREEGDRIIPRLFYQEHLGGSWC